VAPSDPGEIWGRVRERTQATPGIHAAIEALELASFDGARAELRIVDASQSGYVKMSKARIESVLEQVAGRPVKAAFLEAPAPSPSSAARRPASVDPVAQAEVKKDPVVRRAMELFDARIVDIQHAPPEAPPEAPPGGHPEASPGTSPSADPQE